MTNRCRQPPQRRGVFLAVLLIAGVCHSAEAVGQIAAGGQISGYLSDEQGAAVPEAAVVAVNTGTPARRTITSSAAGSFRLLNLEPGEYTVSAERQGFARTERLQMVIREGMDTTLARARWCPVRV
jgi:hypothetical protein